MSHSVLLTIWSKVYIAPFK